MGSPSVACHSDFPHLLLYFSLLLSLLRLALSRVLRPLGLSDLLDPDPDDFYHPSSPPISPTSSLPHRHLHLHLDLDLDLPVVKYGQIVADGGCVADRCCIVCLHDLDVDDDVRRLLNCRHVFHRRCLDRWIRLGRATCPLCRAPLVHGGQAVAELAASAADEFYSFTE